MNLIFIGSLLSSVLESSTILGGHDFGWLLCLQQNSVSVVILKLKFDIMHAILIGFYSVVDAAFDGAVGVA